METLRRTAPLPYWTIAALFAIAGWLTKPPLFLITQSGSHGYWNTSRPWTRCVTC
ncbi:hypothetical protein IEE94_09945 [Yimella sp. cx-573]|nr:hypothetical protein [Yimella sp. cx-573]